MPIPTLTIEDDPNGRPRQPVPLRLACLVTGLTCADFRYLLTVIQEGGWPYLTAYEYRPGDEPREVPPDHYQRILTDAPNTLPSADFLNNLPTDHFVWSDELAGAFSNFVTDCPGREDAAALGYGLVWHPALLGLDTLIEACVDLSPLALAANPPTAPLTRREQGTQKTAARNVRVRAAAAALQADHPDKKGPWIVKKLASEGEFKGMNKGNIRAILSHRDR